MFSQESGRSYGLRRTVGTNVVSVGEAPGHGRASLLENDSTVAPARPCVAIAAVGVNSARHQGVETLRFFGRPIAVPTVSEHSAKDRGLARTKPYIAKYLGQYFSPEDFCYLRPI